MCVDIIKNTQQKTQRQTRPDVLHRTYIVYSWWLHLKKNQQHKCLIIKNRGPYASIINLNTLSNVTIPIPFFFFLLPKLLKFSKFFKVKYRSYFNIVNRKPTTHDKNNMIFFIKKIQNLNINVYFGTYVSFINTIFFFRLCSIFHSDLICGRYWCVCVSLLKK